MSRTFSLNVASPYPTKPFDSGAGSLDQRMLVLCGNDKVDSATSGTWMGTVQLSRIRPFCGRMPLELRLGINDLAAAAGGENAAKLLNLTVPGWPYSRMEGAVTLLSGGTHTSSVCTSWTTATRAHCE